MIKLISKFFIKNAIFGGILSYLTISVLLNTLHLKLSVMVFFGALIGCLTTGVKFIEALNLWRKEK